LKKFSIVLVFIHYFVLQFFSFAFAETFSSQKECEEKTHKVCDFQMCDYKCPEDFINGWVPTNKLAVSKRKRAEIGSEIKIQGQVTGLDISPLAYDGAALMNLYVDDGNELEVHFPSGESTCRADISILEQIKNGDRVEILGRMIHENIISVCDEGQYIKIIAKLKGM